MGAIPPPYAATIEAVADASKVIVNGDAIFFGGCFTSTGAKTIKIYDNGSAASGTLIYQVTLAADESANYRVAGGIACTNGIYVSLSGAGTHVGSVFYAT
tara:strand:- start:410 stop:709 length:300 start_codon:yes stop_codon:yes gene_type:complete